MLGLFFLFQVTIQSKPSGKQYPCPHPGFLKIAPTSSKLKLHMLTHTGERPHKVGFPWTKIWSILQPFKTKIKIGFKNARSKLLKPSKWHYEVEPMSENRSALARNGVVKIDVFVQRWTSWRSEFGVWAWHFQLREVCLHVTHLPQYYVTWTSVFSQHLS